MFLVLLKIKNKIYFESLDTQDEMIDFIGTVENKYGDIEYKKSIVVSGGESDIDEIVHMIEEHYYLHIVGRKIDEKVYKELVVLLGDLKLDVKITYGIEFEEGHRPAPKKVETPKPQNIGTLLNTPIISEIISKSDEIEEVLNTPLYSFYVYWFEDKVVFNLEEMSGFDSASSFIQSFENLDEVMSVFEGFKHDFMEIIESETETSFTINTHLESVKEFIETKISMLGWKSTQAIKYLNGRFKPKAEIIPEVDYVAGDYFTAREVMKKLRISDQTLANWRRCGLIEFKKISNRKYLYMIESVNNIFENGVDTTGVVNITTTSAANLYTPTKPKQINYEEEILNILRPLAFKIPEYKYQKQNFFLNFGNVGISSSPQVMINNQFQLVDFIKKSVIKETPQELYEYLVGVFGGGKEPRIDTSKKIQPEFSRFYLNKLYDKSIVS